MAAYDAASRAADLKDQGNKLFAGGNYLKSAAIYSQALRHAGSLQAHDVSVLYSNRSASLLKLHKVDRALADAEDSIKADPTFHKAWMRKALVLELQQRFQAALECYQQALHLCPGNPDYAARAKILTKLINRAAQTAATSAKQQTKSAAELAALAFADSKLQYAAEQACGDSGSSSFAPELHFLGDHAAETAVRAAHAFDAPELLVQFTAEMCAKSQELAATAAVLIAPKAAVAFPQTWQQPTWPFGKHDGVFVQLQALVKQDGASSQQQQGGRNSQGTKLLRKLWFIQLRTERPPQEPQEVSCEFDLLQPLFKADP